MIINSRLLNLKIILTIVFLTVPLTVYSNCNCETINRDDGVTIKVCEPKPIFGDESLEVAISILNDGLNYYVSSNIKFERSLQKIMGNMIVRFSNNEMITFTVIDSQIALIDGREIAQSIYYVEEFVMNTLKEEDLSTISFRLEDQVLRTYEVLDNKGVLKEQLKCI